MIGGQPRTGLATVRGSTVFAWNPGCNGTVNKLSVYFSNVLVGGLFTTLAGQARFNAGMVSASTGAATTWNPQPNMTVRTFGAVDTLVWMGGDFSSIGGVARSNLAALDLTTGRATSWDPGADGIVWAMEPDGNLLLVGGEFTAFGDTPAAYAASLDPVSGGVGTWSPQPNGFVYAIAVRPNGANKNIVYLGGKFTTLRGFTRNHLGAVDDLIPVTTLEDWDPDARNGDVNALVADANAIYAGGTFTTINAGQPIARLARIRGNGVATGWNASPSADILALALQNGMVYAGFSGQTTIGGTTRRGAAALDTTTAAAKIWTPEPFGSVYSFLPSGTTAMYVGGDFSGTGTQNFSDLIQTDVLPSGVGDANPSFDPEPWSFIPVLLHAKTPGVYALEQGGGKLYAAGRFTAILGKPHSNIAGMYTSTVAVGSGGAVGVALRAQPNPARGSQVLTFTLESKGVARIELFNVAGRLVRTLEGEFDAGPHTLQWDGRDLAGAPVGPGLYFARLGTATAKLLRVD